MQKSADIEKFTPFSGKAMVRGVLSGDSVILSYTGKDSFEGICYLQAVQAPRCGNPSKAEEPFAFDARELVRNKIIGKKVDFTLEAMINGRRYVTIQSEGETINVEVVKAGFAKVLERRSEKVSETYQKMLEAQEDCKKRGVGVFASDPKHIEKHTRQVVYYGENDYLPHKILERANQFEKPLDSILEHVISPSFVSVYIMKLQVVIKLNMIHLYSPQQNDDKGKKFVEKLLLHRTCGVKLTRVDDKGNLTGRIYYPKGDIAREVVKAGYSKVNTPQDSNFDAEYFKDLKQAQIIAQGKCAGIWKDFKPSDSQTNKSGIKEFMSKILEVNSGDSVTVESPNLNKIRIFLSSVKAPAIGRDGKGEPYSWESKENLRKIAIGKKVRVEMEFSKVIPSKQDGGQDILMHFASIFVVSKNNKNLAVAQLEKGLVRTNIMKSGDNASKYLEDLLTAEKKAIDQKLCIHNKNTPPQIIFQDLSQNAKQAREFEMMLQNRASQTFQGVIEYCFSGMRFKIRLQNEGRLVVMNLFGVKTIMLDKNQPALNKYATDAQELAHDILFQREVQVDLYFADKKGNFFGTIIMSNKQDYALRLLEEGLASIHLQGNSKNRLPPNFKQYEDAEQTAKQKELGIWAKQLKLMTGGGNKSRFQPFEELKEVEMTEISSAGRFHVRVLNKNKTHKVIEQALEKFNPAEHPDCERPIKKGTMCAFFDNEDELWYRGKVIGTTQQGSLVKQIDYGTVVDVKKDCVMKKLPTFLLEFEPQAIPATLAYLRTPGLDKQCGKEAAEYVEKYCLNKIYEAVVADEVNGRISLVMLEEGETDWSNSVNAYMIAEGLATLEQNPPEDVADWKEFEEDARVGKLGVWQHGEQGVEDSDEEQ